MKALLGRTHRFLGKYPSVVQVAIALRNQVNCIIAASVGQNGCAMADNGEENVARVLAPICPVFIDVGANTGAWSRHWLRFAPVKRVGTLFEPAKKTFALLEKEFGCETAIRLVNKAVGEKAGKAAFHNDSGFSEKSSLVAGAVDSAGEVEQVDVVTLDEELPSLGIDFVDFCKIDAEGFDGFVLRGAARLLGSHSIRFVQFEYGPAWAEAGCTLKSSIRFLAGKGYECFLVTPRGVRSFDLNHYGEYFAYSNFLADRTEDAALLRRLLD